MEVSEMPEIEPCDQCGSPLVLTWYEQRDDQLQTRVCCSGDGCAKIYHLDPWRGKTLIQEAHYIEDPDVHMDSMGRIEMRGWETISQVISQISRDGLYDALQQALTSVEPEDLPVGMSWRVRTERGDDATIMLVVDVEIGYRYERVLKIDREAYEQIIGGP